MERHNAGLGDQGEVCPVTCGNGKTKEDNMILLVTASSRAKECATALETSARQKVDLAHSVTRALAKLQQAEYDALVVDESLVAIDDAAVTALLNHAGMAMPIYINLGLHCTERLVREVIAGLMRRAVRRETVGDHRIAKSVARRPDGYPAGERTGSAGVLHFTPCRRQDQLGSSPGRADSPPAGSTGDVSCRQ
jgi:hypothetical protein